MLNFPSSPSNGQQFGSWIYDGVKWTQGAATAGAVVQSFNTRVGDVVLTTNDVTAVADSAYVNVTGDTMTGGLTLSYPYPSLSLAKPAAGTAAQLLGYSAGFVRWNLVLGDGVPESGSNAGSNLQINRHNDAGAYIDTTLSINRSSGMVSTTQSLQCNNGRVISYGSSNPALTVYNSAGYAGGIWCESNGTLSFGWCDGAGVPIDTRMYLLRSDGSLNVSGTVAANGSNIGSLGIIGKDMGWWMKFNWDGTNVPAYANGNYACTLVSSVWVGNNYLPRSGGTINNGSNDPLAIVSPQGNYARILSTVQNVRQWSFGCVPAGDWVLSDESAARWAVFKADTNGNCWCGNAIFVQSGWKPGGGYWGDSSDNRIKKIEGPYSKGLNEIMQLKPQVFNYLGNDTTTAPEPNDTVPYVSSPHYQSATSEKPFAGLIAQDIETVFPEMVTHNPGYIDGVAVDDLRMLDTSELTWALVNAIKELAARIVTLEKAQ